MKIALGTVQWGLKYGISNTDGIPSNEELKDIMRIADENNISSLDTASSYGKSEERIGKISKKAYKIITKIGNFKKGNNLNNQIQKSLINLKKHSIYGCMFHNGSELIKNKNLWNELSEYKKSGVIKKIGYSIYEPQVLLELLDSKLLPDIIQVPYSILDRKFEEYFNLLKNFNVEIHIRSVFLQGLYFKSIKELNPNFKDFIKPLTKLENISAKYKLSILDLALCFVLQNSQIDYVILGIETAKQLKEIVNSSKQKLSEKVIKEIKTIKFENPTILNPVNWT